ncbi:fimbrial protein [uncultured Ralstonia sp.]|jgi:major type 1 subunit fimbrin (pilin)|uniref:fimbrial protein n=1 Tax=Ralstonia sp. TaxID=54061 RepID=UPI001EAAC750|nr:fimbrial protein [uncultured Ralstonia sp.]UCF22488.1 MAG: type 1 fimbrial protein [Ralstonia sp.]
MMLRFKGRQGERSSVASQCVPRWWLASCLFIASVMGLLGWSTSASAKLTCVQTSGYFAANIPALRISASTPVNTVLWSTTGIQVKAECGKQSATGAAENAWVYRQNVDLGSGLSLYVTYNGNRGNTFEGFNTGTKVSNFYIQGIKGTEVRATVDIQLVKTGTTPTSGAYSFETTKQILTIGGPNMMEGFMSGGANFVVAGLDQVSFVPSTCKAQTASIAVDLGTVRIGNASGFGSAIGTTSASKDFNVNLNCDVTAAGAYKIMMQLDGTTVPAYANQGVLALNGGSTAAGLGVQVLRGASSGSQAPVTFGTPWQIGSFPLTLGALSVPFSARYYQTAARITPGTANSSATFTLLYQ